jgi:DNA repair exonuclease SbcCD nuclease subunit
MRFLHTADWQIGMKCAAAGDRAKDARAERLVTVKRIVDVANERDIDFMLIAGDLFDTLTPKAADMGVVVAELKRVKAPVFVLPGNHDPAGNRGPYASAAWRSTAASGVVTVERKGVHSVPGGELLVSPCEAKYGVDDPTAWFGERESPPGAIRVGVAHGSLQLGEIAKTKAGDMRGHFPISPEAASRGRLDYLALGDWHSYMAFNDGKALISYSGTPEPTAFGEKDSGTVSIVNIESPGERPNVERIEVGRLRWVQRDYEVSDDASITRLNGDLMALTPPSQTLVRAIARGLCTPSAAEQLHAFEEGFRRRFFSFELRHEYVAQPETREAWLEIVPPGDLRELVGSLLDRIERGEDAAVARRALDKLAEFAR